jgi:N-acetylglucosaminyldiphosphoundecaprenol N-acetyl-beta-D-mannosaminyltransferase
MAAAPVTYDILGFKITPITIAQILELIQENVQSRTTCVVVSQNVHGLYKYFTDDALRELHQRACVRIDGMPVLWLARLCGLPVTRQHRAGMIDCLPRLLARAAAEGWRVFFLGGTPEVQTSGCDNIRRSYVTLQMDGHHGYFDASLRSTENDLLVARINSFRPDILIVGMGMGRQERWVLENQHRLQAHCIWTCGALLEYVAGTAPVAPRWLGQIGLEWAYRLCSNPRRFAWRYLVEPWVVVGLILVHKWRR